MCALLGLTIMLAVATSAVPVRADGIFTLREVGVQAGGGNSRRSGVQLYTLQPYFGLKLWEPIESWFDGFGVDALWMIEPWAAFVRDKEGESQGESFEIGVSPVFFRLTFGDGSWRPYIEGGLGIAYTDLRTVIRTGNTLGQRIQFSSQGGVGLQYALGPDSALALSVRFRHISNAGISSENPGIDTVYGLVGFIFR